MQKPKLPKKSVLAEKVTANVRAIRTAKGLPQAALAKLAGRSVAYVSLIERGEREPTLLTVERLAAALGVGPQKLLGL